LSSEFQIVSNAMIQGEVGLTTGKSKLFGTRLLQSSIGTTGIVATALVKRFDPWRVLHLSRPDRIDPF
jgi:hypothetical protein